MIENSFDPTWKAVGEVLWEGPWLRWCGSSPPTRPQLCRGSTRYICQLKCKVLFASTSQRMVALKTTLLTWRACPGTWRRTAPGPSGLRRRSAAAPHARSDPVTRPTWRRTFFMSYNWQDKKYDPMERTEAKEKFSPQISMLFVVKIEAISQKMKGFHLCRSKKCNESNLSFVDGKNCH